MPYPPVVAHGEGGPAQPPPRGGGRGSAWLPVTPRHLHTFALPNRTASPPDECGPHLTGASAAKPSDPQQTRSIHGRHPPKSMTLDFTFTRSTDLLTAAQLLFLVVPLTCALACLDPATSRFCACLHSSLLPIPIAHQIETCARSAVGNAKWGAAADERIALALALECHSGVCAARAHVCDGGARSGHCPLFD